MIPNRHGLWLHIPSGKELEVYPLTPAGNQLCIWGPDAGITYSGAAETQGVWTTDEWQGHIPVQDFDNNENNWKKKP